MKKLKLDNSTLIKINNIVDFSFKENLKDNIIELVKCELFYNLHKDNCDFIQDKINKCSCGILLEEASLSPQQQEQLKKPCPLCKAPCQEVGDLADFDHNIIMCTNNNCDYTLMYN